MVDEIKATGVNFRTSPIGRLGTDVRSSKPTAEIKTEVTDRVEISELATWLGKYSELPSVRSQLVAQVRAQIEAGKYETPEKWNQAIESLIEDLTS